MILSEEQTLIQQAIRRFAQEQIAPRAAQFEAARAYPKELFQDLA
ncbi:MAG: acyl-CoA dehydrogenase, partial [Alphaproteobacteria bacterium]